MNDEVGWSGLSFLRAQPRDADRRPLRCSQTRDRRLSSLPIPASDSVPVAIGCSYSCGHDK